MVTEAGRPVTAGDIEAAFRKSGIKGLPAAAFLQFELYLEVLLRWNERLSLTSLREPGEIIQRHLVESAFAAQSLPPDIENLLDYGSGAGLPGIPIAICRPTIRVMLAESQGKKASFLREVLRVAGVAGDVYEGRVENIAEGICFDAVCLRAVEKMELAIPVAVLLAKRYLVLLTTRDSAAAYTKLAPELEWFTPIMIPYSEQRIVLIGQRV